jgi:RHS repeat-associated protein
MLLGQRACLLGFLKERLVRLGDIAFARTRCLYARIEGEPMFRGYITCEGIIGAFRLVRYRASVQRCVTAAILMAASAFSAAAQVMSVPGKFAVNETGAASYKIDIAVPPGTAGLVPELALEYKSQGGDGMIGVGWALSGLPSISRCPRTVAQDGVAGAVKYDANDRFCIDGERLVAISGMYGADGAEYRTEIDHFTKIVSRGTAGTGPAWFEVWTKGGRIMRLGNTTDSRLLAAGKAAVHIWAVNRIADTAGNYIAVTYINDAANTQLYPSRVDYTGNAVAGLAPYNSVRLVYAMRPDIVPLYHENSLIKATQRLTNVQSYEGASLVNDYRLTYQQGSSTGRSQLTSITRCDGSNICLPATTFTWQPGTISQVVISNPAAQNGALGQYRPYIADFDGDGRSDVLWDHGFSPEFPSTRGTRVLWTSLGNGSFSIDPNLAGRNGEYSGSWLALGDFNRDGRSDIWWLHRGWSHDIHPPYPIPATKWLSTNSNGYTIVPGPEDPRPTCSGDAYEHQRVITDINNDGRADMMSYRACLQGGWPAYHDLYIHITNPDGVAATTISNVPPSSTARSSLDSVDFNGDGKADVLWLDGNVGYMWLGNGDGTFQKISGLDMSNVYQQGPNQQGIHYVPYFADFNGDGKSDVLWVRQDIWGRSNGFGTALWLSKGDSTFVMITNPGGNTMAQHAPYLGDFNGDGKTDILWSRKGTTALSNGIRVLWLGKGDGTFTVVSNFAGQDGNLIGYVPMLADFNGDGKTDVLWDSRSGSDTRSTGTRALWLSDGVAPDLMIGITTGLGANIALTYKPLIDSAVYTKDNDATDPLLDLSGPIQVVSRVDISNGIGGTVRSTYAYAGAKAHLDGRGFLGFRQKRVTDLQTGIVRTTTYRQDYPYNGEVASEISTLAGVTLSSVVNTYGATSLGGTRHHVFLQQKEESGADLDGAPLPTVTTVYQYDAYGNTTQIAVATSDGHSKTTTHSFTNDTANWRLGRMTAASVTSQNAQGSATRTLGFGYDSATGLITREEIEPGQPLLRLQTDYVYDAFGNKTQATVSGADILPRSASATYDPQGRFVLSKTNALAQSESRQHDPRFGVPTSHIDSNNLTTAWSYDSFGRKTFEVRPDSTRTKWEYLFCNGVSGGTASCPTDAAYLMRATPLASDGTTQNGPMGTVYFDRLDREIAKDIQGFDGSISRIATEYDSLGRVHRRSRPYFVSGGTPQWTVFSYDALARVVTETRPDSSTAQIAYHGLVTVETNALNQTRTITKNSQGKVVSVTDALNKTTTYVYDPFGNPIQTTDPVGNIVTASYDGRGRKIGTNDPNLGSWTHGYDVLDQLVSQVDAKAQTTTLTYDKLGRLVQRVEPDMTAEWVYDTAANGIGKLASTSITAGPETGYQRTLSYDGLSRPVQVVMSFGGATVTFGATYDANGRPGSVTYPSGFAVNYVYTSLGYMHQLTDSLTAQPYWTANARDAELHLTQDTLANGVVTNRSFNANTGRLTGITAGPASSTVVQNLSYTYDALGNVLTRADANTGLSEGFAYDELNRLTSATVGSSPAKTFAYDPIGNILSKSDVGTYSYPAPGQPRPHAVQSVSGATINTTFSYDANGNQTSGLGRTVTYTSYNKPSTITQGTRTISFGHDPDHQRFWQATPEGTTFYLRAFGVYAEYQTGVNRWNEYLAAGGRMIGVRLLNPDETVLTGYFHHDHLGSISVITTASALVERNSYDAWGKRRFPDGTDDPAGSIISATTRGFTGEEELSGFGLVHLNGRVYDPKVGRMMSADPLVPEPMNGEAWNRYSYVINNPLKYTDPTGHTTMLPPITVCGFCGTLSDSGFGGGDFWLVGGSGGASLGYNGGGYYSISAPSMSYYGDASKSLITAFSAPRYDLLRLPSVTSGNVWKSVSYDAAVDALPGGAEYASTSEAYVELDPVTVDGPGNRVSKVNSGAHSHVSGVLHGSPATDGAVCAFFCQALGGPVETSFGTYNRQMFGLGMQITGGTAGLYGGAMQIATPGPEDVVIISAIASITPRLLKMTQWGWAGGKAWRDAVRRVDRGGTIVEIGGKIPTKSEAQHLIQQAKGRIGRIEDGHPAPNPHSYPHINYTTSSGMRGTIRIDSAD